MNASAVAYLAPRAVLAVKLTPAPRPRHASRSGYGTQVPTATLIQLPDKRWRRVYVCITSNIGTSYVRTARAPFLVIGPEAQETIAAGIAKKERKTNTRIVRASEQSANADKR